LRLSSEGFIVTQYNSKLNSDKIPIYRQGVVVTDFLSIFGSNLRETRLSAALGYVISKIPMPFLKAFKIRGELKQISIEYEEFRKRVDVLIETEREYFIIETKVADVDPVKQILNYAKTLKKEKPVRGLGVVPYNPKERYVRSIRIIGWDGIDAILKEILKGKVRYQDKFLIQEVRNHMLKHHLIAEKDFNEIYAREIGNIETLQLFLKCGIYQCSYEQSENIYSVRYFAPHFSGSLAKIYPGVRQGISYIAKIEDIVRAKDKKSYVDEICKHRGRSWYKKEKDLLLCPFKIWGEADRNIVFLEPPKLVFNPTIKKENLQKGSGWLSKRFFSFDDLFKAMNK